MPVSTRFTITDFDAAMRPEVLNTSMRARRQVGWEIVNRVLAPVPAAGGAIPLWMTWYEQEDIAELYEAMLERRGRTGKTDAVAAVNDALRRKSEKNLNRSLASSRLGKILRQSTFPEHRDLGPHRTPGTGSIYYSPAYVAHLLANADRIANCDAEAYPNPSSKASRRGGPLTGVSSIPDIESVPARLRPADQKNLYALCMDHEMPRDAVMVKTAWYPARRSPRRGDIRPTGDDIWFPGLRYFQMDSAMAPRLSAGTAGEWIEKPYLWPEGARMSPPGDGWNGAYLVTDERGQEWGLFGIHIAVKAIRNWIWVSLFRVAGDEWGWRGERGAIREPFSSRQITGSFYNYAMCVVSDFTEGDAAPWSTYQGGNRLEQMQADTLRAVAGVMRGSPWCSNPYIETSMARGNCIGCHQGSPDSFLPTAVTKQRGFNISDFSFSFTTNRERIIEIRQRHGLGGKR